MPRDDFEDFDGQPIDPHSAELQRALVAWSRDSEDDDDLSPDLDDSRAIDVVRERDGRELLSEATDPAREAREIAARATEPDDEDEQPRPAAEAKPEQPKAEAAPDDTAKLLAAIPAAHRPAVTALAERAAHFADLEAISAPFADELKQNGMTVVDGYRKLAEHHRFASTDPGGYMAWFTAQVVPAENRAKALIQVGKALGVKLVEDEFGLDDDEDAKPEPVNVEAARQKASSDLLLTSFEGAKGPDGQPAHPLFASQHPLSGAVHRAMTQAIQQDVAAGKTAPATIAQLRPYYNDSVAAITAALPAANTDAQQKVDKARRASSPIATAVAAPRQAPAPIRPRPSQDDGSDTLLAGLKALFPAGDDQ